MPGGLPDRRRPGRPGPGPRPRAGRRPRGPRRAAGRPSPGAGRRCRAFSVASELELGAYRAVQLGAGHVVGQRRLDPARPRAVRPVAAAAAPPVRPRALRPAGARHGCSEPRAAGGPPRPPRPPSRSDRRGAGARTRCGRVPRGGRRAPRGGPAPPDGPPAARSPSGRSRAVVGLGRCAVCQRSRRCGRCLCWRGSRAGHASRATPETEWPLTKECPAASYSPTRSPAQYHRR